MGLADQIAKVRRRKGQPQGGTLEAIAGTRTPARPGRAPRAGDRRGMAGKRGGKFDWGDGRGAIHTISREQHRTNVRTQRDDKNPLYQPTQQLSGSALSNAAGDLVNLEYGPQKAALGRQLTNETAQGTALVRRAADYSGQLQRQDAALPGQVGAIGTLLGQKLGANTNASMDAIRAQLDAARQATGQAEQSSGVQSGTGNPVELEGVSQIARLASQGQASQDTAALNTQSFQQLAALSGQARGQMGQEVQGQLLNRLANAQGETRAKQTDLAAQEGAAKTQAVTSLRQQAFENLITQQGLGIKSQELEAETAQAQARIAETAKARRATERQRREDRKSRERIAADNLKARREADRAARAGKDEDVNKYGISNGRWKGMAESERMKVIERDRKSSRSGRSRAGSKMPASAIDTRTGIDNALIDVKQDPKLTRHAGRNDYNRVEAILKNRGAPPIVAKAAREIAEKGRLSDATISALRRAKVKVPNSWINPTYNRPGAAGPALPPRT